MISESAVVVDHIKSPPVAVENTSIRAKSANMIFKNKQQQKDQSSTSTTLSLPGTSAQLTSVSHTPTSNSIKEPLVQQSENKKTLMEAPTSASRGRISKASLIPANNKDYESVTNYLSDIVVEAADSDSVNSSSNSSCNNSSRGRGRPPKNSITQQAPAVTETENVNPATELRAQRLSIPRSASVEPEASATTSVVNSARKRSSALPPIAPPPQPASAPQLVQIKNEPTSQSSKQSMLPLPHSSGSGSSTKSNLPPLPPSSMNSGQLNKKPKRPVESIYESSSANENSMKPPVAPPTGRPPVPTPHLHVPANVLRTNNNSANNNHSVSNTSSSSSAAAAYNSFNSSSQSSMVNDTTMNSSNNGPPRSPRSPNPSNLNGKKMRMSPNDDESNADSKHSEHYHHFPTGYILNLFSLYQC